MLAFEFILDDRSVEQAFEGIKQLEFADDGVAVVERLGQHGGKSSLELPDALAEVEEVVIKFSLLDVHDVVLNGHEILNGFAELLVDLLEGGSHSLALCVADFNLLELVELLDGAGQVHDVYATFGESIKTDEQRIGGDLPLVL